MTIKRLCEKMREEGLDARLTELWDPSTATSTAPAILVYHDYEGPYPGRAQFDAHDHADRLARKYGYAAEQRGHYGATWVTKRP